MLSNEEVVKVSIMLCPDLNISIGQPYTLYRKVINKYRVTDDQLPLIPIYGGQTSMHLGSITQDNQIIFRRSWCNKMLVVSEEYLKRLQAAYKVKKLGKYKFQISPKE